MKDLRIALIGSHGTGKTSIVEELARITKIPIIEELARNYNMNTPDMDEYKHYQKQLLLEQLKAEAALFLSKGSFISDRSSIDNTAYFLLKCYENSTREEKRRYTQIAIHNSLRYTHLFYVPIEIPLPKDDGFRFKGELFRESVDKRINDIIRYYGVEVTPVTGSLNERVSKILEVIEWK